MTVANSLANVTAGRKVHLLYVQNAKILNWQNMIGDDSLQQVIAKVQEGGIDLFTDFKDFTNYSTFFKIGIMAEESNALSQMWAWALADNNSQLVPVLQSFIENAQIDFML